MLAATTTQQVSIGSPRTRAESLRRSRSYRALRASPLGILGVAMLALVVIAALAPGLLTHYDPVKLLLQDKFLPPSAEHWFGTDDVGRDVYTRVVYGARVTLLSTLMVLVLAASIGTVVGALAGFYGGWLDSAVMRVTDMFLAFPALILALAINAALGRGLTQAMLAVAISWLAVLCATGAGSSAFDETGGIRHCRPGDGRAGAGGDR